MSGLFNWLAQVWRERDIQKRGALKLSDIKNEACLFITEYNFSNIYYMKIHLKLKFDGYSFFQNLICFLMGCMLFFGICKLFFGNT